MFARETVAETLELDSNPIIQHSLGSSTGVLTNNIVHLAELVNTLHDKLHPVLLPPGPMPSPPEREYREQAPAVRELLVLNDKVAYLKEEVSDLICRLSSI
jgi:hypothetical protein